MAEPWGTHHWSGRARCLGAGCHGRVLVLSGVSVGVPFKLHARLHARTVSHLPMYATRKASPVSSNQQQASPYEYPRKTVHVITCILAQGGRLISRT